MADSVWKREISLKRKPKDEAAAPSAEAPATEEAPAADRVPWWKKDVSLARKEKAEKPSKPAKAEGPEEPEKPEMPEKPKGDGVPFWKKDVSLGRKKRDEAEPQPEAGQEHAPDEEQPADPEQLPVTEPVAEPVAEEPLDAVAERIAPFVAAAAEAAARAQAQTEAQEAALAQSAAEATVELPAPLNVEAPELVEPAAGAPVPVPEAAPPAPEAALPEPVDTWTQPPEVPPEPVSAPVAVAATPAPPPPPAVQPTQVVHPPVPASELPPLPGEKPGGKPFWKRDLSLGRKQDVAAEPETEAAVAPEFADEAPASVPFWKRGISIGRKKAREAEPTDEPRAEKPRKAPKQKPLKERSKGAKAPKKLVGLKIGASQIAAARVSNNGVAELVQAVREPLEPGVIVGGELRDPEALAEVLKDFFAKNKLPKRGVRLGIANNRIGVRTFEITGIHDQKQLANAIKFRAQEALPIPIEDAVLDYHVLDERVDDEGQPIRRILLVVAYRELVDRYVDACRKAGIQLAGIDLEAFALLRALAPPQDGSGGDSSAALVAVAIGHDRSTFAVSDGRVCEFTRVLEWGGSSLNVAVARELNATPSQVEQVKRELSLAVESVPEGLTAEQATAARDAVRKQVQSFARELVSSLQFYQSQPNSLGIGEIVLTGGTAHLDGLDAELQRLIGVRVRVGDPLARVKLPKKFDNPEQAGSLTVAIGLGIED